MRFFNFFHAHILKVFKPIWYAEYICGEEKKISNIFRLDMYFMLFVLCAFRYSAE